MASPAALPPVRGQHRNRALAAARQARAVQLATEGLTYQQIADELGYATAMSWLRSSMTLRISWPPWVLSGVGRR